MSTAERIFKEVEKLPDTLAQEVLDFIEYIEIKHGLRDRLTEELKQAQEPAMRHVWDNQERRGLEWRVSPDDLEEGSTP